MGDYILLDSQGEETKYAEYQWIIGMNLDILQFDELSPSAENALNVNGRFRFVALNYDLKAGFHGIPSLNPPFFEFPMLWIAYPKILLKMKWSGELEICSQQTYPIEVLNKINQQRCPESDEFSWDEMIAPALEKYSIKYRAIQSHLRQGDIYEMNYCHLFTTKNRGNHKQLTPWYLRKSKRTRKPYSAILKVGNRCVYCYSPERFLARRDNQLITQPIKGTLRKDESSFGEKEYAENVMIVDLCRNDLASVSKTGSVKVEELMGEYGFTNIMHLISTVKSTQKEGISFIEILRSCFPMGSMTGAPKDSAIRIIESLEDFRRGLYSGSLGYINDSGDFDFNVVIRSLFYDKDKGKAHIPVGGAILYGSDLHKEFQETLDKIHFFTQ